MRTIGEKRRFFSQRTASVCAAIVFAYAMTVILNWLAGGSYLRSHLAPFFSVGLGLAAAMALLAAASFLTARRAREKTTRTVAIFFSSVIFVTCAILEISRATGIKPLPSGFLLDGLMVAGEMNYASRLGNVFLGLFVLLAATIILNALKKRALLSQIVSGAVIFTASWFILFGMAGSEPANSWGADAVTMTALVLLALSTALNQPNDGLLAVVNSDSLGGATTRLVLPFTFLAPLLVGAIGIQVRRLDLLDGRMEVAILSVSGSVVLTALALFLGSIIIKTSGGLITRSHEQQKLAEQLNALVDSMPIGIMIVDAVTRRCVRANRRSQEICGESLVEGITGTFGNIQRLLTETGEDYPLNRLPQEIAIREGREALADDIIAVRPDGSRVRLRIHAQPVMNGNRMVTSAIIVIDDMTKETEERRQRTEFVSMLSHQLKSPLASIRWIMEELLGGDFGDINEEQREAVQQALTSASGMVALVKDLLNASRIESDRMETKAEWHVAADFIDDAVNELSPAAKARKITLSVSNTSRRRLLVDVRMMQQVVSNLVSNAVKYSPENSTVTVSAADTPSGFSLSVKDNGIGIPQEQQDKLFGKYFRADNAKRTSTEGTGLGLYVCRYLIKSMGGDISFVSAPGKGTTFTVTLPNRDEGPA